MVSGLFSNNGVSPFAIGILNNCAIDLIEKFKIAPSGSVIICAEGGSAGRKLGILNQDVCFVNKLFALTPNEKVIGKYIFYWYQSNNFQKDFQDKMTGLIGGVSKLKFQNIKIPIPSIVEQKQIVEILDKAFESIEQAKINIEKNIENTKELFQSKLNQVFSEKGEGWEEKKLADFYLIKHGYAFDGKLFEISENKDLPIVLTPGNYHENGGLYFTKKNTKRTHAKYPLDFLFDAGDLTVVMTDLSSKMKILGLPAIIESCNILHNQRIGKFISKGNDEHFDKKFLYYFLKSKKYLNKFQKIRWNKIFGLFKKGFSVFAFSFQYSSFCKRTSSDFILSTFSSNLPIFSCNSVILIS